MMDIGPPDQKRPRLAGPAPPGPWQTSPETSRQLPPPPAPGYTQHPSPFSGPEPQPHPLDRRHSEHTQYEHQDPRRPTSGPSHGYHPPPPPPTYGGPRDPMVKRDPSDEPPQQYRPSSTGNGPDHNVNVPPPPHYEGSGRPVLPPFDSRPNPPPYQPSPYPPTPSPMSASEPYSHPVYGTSGLPPPRDSYPSVPYPSARPNPEQVRKKAQRAAQACDSCRTLKAKCDEGRPACSSCKEKGTECRYRDPPPKQQDKASADIMDSLARIEAVVNIMGGQVNSLGGKMERVEQYIHRTDPAGAASLKEEPNFEAPVYLAPRRSIGSEALPSNESPYSSTPGQQQIPERMEHLQGDGEEPEEEEEEEGGDPGPQGAPSIPVNHTTGAARLLLVGPIAEMVAGGLKAAKVKNEKYPMLQEKKRGSIRLYGRGEGTDTPPGYDKDPLTDNETSSTPGDTHSDASSPAAYETGENWGQFGGLTPPGNPAPEITRGAIGPEGMPDFSRPVVIDLVKSYKDNMNNMHPILIPRHLDALVEWFLKNIPDSQAKPKQVSTLVGHATGHAPPVGFVGGAGTYRNPESPGNKRKRSPGLGGDYPEPRDIGEQKPGHPYRSMSSCLVLLVMALGKICQHKGKLPDVVHDRESESSSVNSPNIKNGYPPSPLQSSPSISSTMGLPSPHEGARSRRTSIEGAYTTRGLSAKPRNLDVIPGLAYFALATDILGNQIGGNSLQHVHAHILAGLYYGQLGRVLDSAAHIHVACRILQVLLRVKLDRFKKIKAEPAIPPAKDNPLIFAFWTCLQLESDIVAELPYPQSGILTYEDDMPTPNLQAASNVDGFDPIIIESYGAQLFLRKHLNALHNMFYRPTTDSQFHPIFSGKETPNHFPTIEASQEHLNNITSFSPNMKWTDDDPLAIDILSARLRAKFYGAQVITYRPFILKVLEHSAARSSRPGETISEDYVQEIGAPAVNKDATRIDEIDPKVLDYAKKCIKALINSTKAFHGLGNPGKVRLIVTNIWGTAHAQWGNVLTLQAAYMDPILRPLVDERELADLTHTTLEFLLLVAQPSSALWVDYRILKWTAQYTKLIAPEGPNTSSSFSSTTTGDVTMSGH